MIMHVNVCTNQANNYMIISSVFLNETEELPGRTSGS